VSHFVPPGWHAVTPRIVVEDPAGLVAFLERVFGATGDRRGMIRDRWGNLWQVATHRAR
jgi:uncharacterized glyoxalase superfamily protein PhnB